VKTLPEWMKVNIKYSSASFNLKEALYFSSEFISKTPDLKPNKFIQFLVSLYGWFTVKNRVA
jgi:hypothetical protein